MVAEKLNQRPEPTFDVARPGASLDRIDQLVVPIGEPILSGYLPGEHASHTKGTGFERDGTRPYVTGDDPRQVDWAATARTPDHTMQVRETYRDVSPNVWLATDMPKSRNRVNPGHFSEQALALSAASGLLLLAQNEGMPTGLVTASDRRSFQSEAPGYGQDNTLELGMRLKKLGEDSKEDAAGNPDIPRLGGLLKRVADLATESVVIIISDFRDVVDPAGEEGWKRSVQELKHNGNELLAVELINPWDYKVPDRISRFRLTDRIAWLGGKDAREIQGRYAYKGLKQQKQIDRELKAVDATHIKLRTDEAAWFTSLRTQLDRTANHKQ